MLHQANQQQVELKLKNLKEMQEQIRTWGRDCICQKVLDAARNYEVKLDGKVVQRFQQIGVAYSRDSSQEMHQTMFNVMYKSFRQNTGWARALEAVYMEEENLAYIRDEDGMENKKGFIEVYMTEQYNDIKRGIKRRCSNTHGTAVRLREAPLPKKNKKNVTSRRGRKLTRK